MTRPAAYRILINGIVQGVGFRPFIFRLASRYSLTGWVKNTSSGVEIEVEGTTPGLEGFLQAIRLEAPPLCRIDSLEHQPIQPPGCDQFEIRDSQVISGGFQPISPDVCICGDCLTELFSPDDFRYRYPFINCTNCGPRFTIIKGIPYDRPLTTMAGFGMCPVCKAEYEDPHNRRFHAQPVACPECGPRVWLENARDPKQPAPSGDQAILETQRLLGEGSIVAVKGLGGFHLACDAENQAAVQRLRAKKDRPAKPLAVMMPDLETVRIHCLVSKEDELLLMSPQRPILLLEKKPGSSLAEGIAPGQNQVGVMLPYTPLHYLLFAEEADFPAGPLHVLVMTSANLRGNPILTGNQEVKELLGEVADVYLLHDRDIQIHCDDSVARTLKTSPGKDPRTYPIRRSRGYSPQPLLSPFSGSMVLGVGAELKNTFCLTKDSYAFLSQHIGDLKNYETLLSFQESIEHYQRMFLVEPELLVADLHPDYLSSRYAGERSQEQGIPLLPVQHHHAHIAACLADNGYQAEEPVIGLAFDGIGFGDDGAIWGGEFLIADYLSYNRAGHLDYFPLPGGDQAVREPWRTALGLLHHYGIPWEQDIPAVAFSSSLPEPLPGVQPAAVLQKQLQSGTNSPWTSSLGRLFDGVASLLGICHRVSYEGQAAIELESQADPVPSLKPYPLDLSSDLVYSPQRLLEGVLSDLRSDQTPGMIAARFHHTLAELVLQVALTIKGSHGLEQVALSGGVWQNMTLLKLAVNRLQQAGFQVLLHQQVPTNDGGLSFGQAVMGQKYIQDQGAG